MSGKVALSICCLFFSNIAFAGTYDIRASNNQLGIRKISTDVDYTETGNGRLGTQTGKLDTETGKVPGYAISISTMQGPGNEYFEAEYDHSSGYTTYTGMPATGGVFGSIVGTSSATLINYSARFGRGFTFDEIGDRLGRRNHADSFMVTPYVELGHHQWDRGVNLGETYTHHYAGIGALWQYSPVSKLVFSANTMFGHTFRSYIIVNGPYGFSGSLGNSATYKVGLSADYAFMKHFHGNIGADYTNFKYGISDIYPVGGGYVAWEPDSETNYTTIKVGLGYAF